MRQQENKSEFNSYNSRGFTLVELMVVVAIIAIMAIAWGANFIGMRPNRNMYGDARDLLSSIQTIRLDAVKRNTCVGLTLQPVTTVTGGGYIVFLDDGTGGGTACNAVRDGAERILQTVRIHDRVALHNSPVAATVADPAVTSLPLGLTTTSLFTSLSFNQRSMLQTRVNAGNGGCVLTHNGNSAPLSLRVLVRANGIAVIERNSNPSDEAGWSN